MREAVSFASTNFSPLRNLRYALSASSPSVTTRKSIVFMALATDAPREDIHHVPPWLNVLGEIGLHAHAGLSGTA